MKRLIPLFVLLVPLLAVAPQFALAENLGPGGGTRIIAGDEIVGPYQLFVTVAPEPAEVGLVTFVVRISDPGSGDKVRDAAVTVELVHSEDGTVVTQTATHEDAGNPLEYAAHVHIEEPGVYAGTVRVTGTSGQAEVAFTQRVLAQRRFSTLLVIGLPFLVILGVLGGLWYARSGARAGN